MTNHEAPDTSIPEGNPYLLPDADAPGTWIDKVETIMQNPGLTELARGDSEHLRFLQAAAIANLDASINPNPAVQERASRTLADLTAYEKSRFPDGTIPAIDLEIAKLRLRRQQLGASDTGGVELDAVRLRLSDLEQQRAERLFGTQ